MIRSQATALSASPRPFERQRTRHTLTVLLFLLHSYLLINSGDIDGRGASAAPLFQDGERWLAAVIS